MLEGAFLFLLYRQVQFFGNSGERRALGEQGDERTEEDNVEDQVGVRYTACFTHDGEDDGYRTFESDPLEQQSVALPILLEGQNTCEDGYRSRDTNHH